VVEGCNKKKKRGRAELEVQGDGFSCKRKDCVDYRRKRRTPWDAKIMVFRLRWGK